MLALKASNQYLINSAEFSYLQANYASGVSSLVVMNVDDFQAFDQILLGEFGSESSEIVQIDSIVTATRTLTLASPTRFPHPESTRVTILPYNRVLFYRGTTTTFADSSLLTESTGISVQADDFYTRYIDNVNASGYGWFKFILYSPIGGATSEFTITNTSGTTFRYTFTGTGTNPVISKLFVGESIVINAQNFSSGNNGTFVITNVGANYFEVTNTLGVAESTKTIGTGSITVLIYSAESNAIPYSDFANNSAKKIIDAFFSQLNNKEVSLVTREDAFYWLNEAYAIAVNELNLVNQQFNVPAIYTIPVVAGTQEYLLPTNFGKMIGLGSENGEEVGNISIRKLVTTQLSYSTISKASDMFYYIRGGYIGFFPVPTMNMNLNLAYESISTTLNSLYDTIVLPQNNYYFLMDYMLFRAAPKLGKSDGSARLELFQGGIERMKVTSLKQDANLDSWSIHRSNNV